MEAVNLAADEINHRLYSIRWKNKHGLYFSFHPFIYPKDEDKPFSSSLMTFRDWRSRG